MSHCDRRSFLTRMAALPGGIAAAASVPSLLRMPAAFAQPPSFFTLRERDRRWANVRAMMSAGGFDCLVLPHRSGDDVNQLMYADYVSGGGFFPFGDAAVVVPIDGEPVLVHAAFPSPWISNRYDLSFTRNGDQVSLGDRLVEVIQDLDHARGNIAVVGTQAGVDGLNEFMNEGLVTYATWSTVVAGLPRASFADVTEQFSLLMLVKSAEEIANIEKSALLGERLHQVLLGEVRIGMSDRELRATVDRFLAINGARADVQALVMAPGPINDGDVINSEYGVVYSGGYSQVTLCIAAGTMSDEMRRLSDVAHQLMDLGAATLRAGRTFGDVIEPLEKLVSDAGYWHRVPHIHGILPMTLVGPVYLKGPDNPGSKCLGADVVVQEGMAFSFEPAARVGPFAEAKVGATAVVTADGLDVYNSIGTRVQQI